MAGTDTNKVTINVNGTDLEFTKIGNILGPSGKDGINGKSIYANTVDPWSVSGWNPVVAGDLFLNTTTGILWSAKAGAVTSNVQSNWTKVGELAGKITVDSALSSTSTNPVQNKVIKSALDGKAGSSHSHSSLTNSSGRIFNVPTGGSGGEQKTLVITDDLNAYQPAGNYASSTHDHDSLYQAKGNYVTTDTAQTITGDKTFSTIRTNSNIIVNDTNNDTHTYYKNKQISYIGYDSDGNIVDDYTYTLPDKSGTLATTDIATSSAAGLVKSSTTGTTSNRDYKVQVNSDGTMKVNVPWTDTNTTYSTATQSANGLMSASDKKKLDGIAEGANKITVDSSLSSTSTNPVQNKVIKSALDGKAGSSHSHSSLTNSSGRIFNVPTGGSGGEQKTLVITDDLNAYQPAGNYASASHDHTISDINGLYDELTGMTYVVDSSDNSVQLETYGNGNSFNIPTKGYVDNALNGKSDTSHTHNYLPLSGGSLGGIVRGGAIDVHPENGGTIIGYYTNDLAFMLKRGGSCVAKNVTRSTSISVNENWFDASPSYGSFTVTAVTDVVQIIIKSPVQYSWGTNGGIGFGAAAWRAKSVKFELGYSPTNKGSASNPDSDIVWVTRINITNNSQGLVYTNNFTGPSVSEGGTSSTSWSYIRITLTDWNNTTPRIAQIFSVNFGSAGMHNAFLSRSGGTIYGTIIPYANNSYYLGSSTNKWAGVYATTFNENGVTLTDKYAAKSHTHNEYVTGTDFSAYTSWIEGEVNGKSDIGHTHSISNVSGLQSALDDKSGTGHTHTSLNTAFVFNNRDMPQEATNLSTTTTAHTINFYRNALSIPYQMDNANDGGILRCRGNSESNVIFELATWDDSGAGETIQFNYYPTTSQITPTYSVSVPKKTGTIALTSDIPSSLPASDVYDWAKASTKPSYTASEVGAASSGHTHDGRYIRWNGSAANVDAMGWGTLTAANGYTILSHCSSSDGGDWGMVNKGGQIFMQLDGYYYQNEGKYRVLDTSNISMSFSNGVLTITYK